MTGGTASTTIYEGLPGGNSAEALRIRLDTSNLIRQLELWLKGKYVTVEVNQNTGQEYLKEHKIGTPLANDEGQQKLLAWVSMHTSPAVVQGNMDKIKFGTFIKDMYITLNDLVVLNCEKWEIDDRDIAFIVSGFMNMSELFLSRTIDNQERLLFNMQSDRKETTIREKDNLMNQISSMGVRRQ